MSKHILKFFTEKSQEFSTARKQRGKNLPESLAPVDNIQKYVETKCFDAMHSASNPGIVAFDMQVNTIL
jgi:hypothetical protein